MNDDDKLCSSPEDRPPPPPPPPPLLPRRVVEEVGCDSCIGGADGRMGCGCCGSGGADGRIGCDGGTGVAVDDLLRLRFPPPIPILSKKAFIVVFFVCFYVSKMMKR